MTVRRMGIALAVLLVPLVLATPTTPDLRLAGQALTVGPPTSTAGGRCGDATASWMGGRWREPMRWRFRAAGTPGYLGSVDAVRDAVRRAGENVDLGRNPCGLPADLDITQHYDGDTRATAGVDADGGCTARDGANVVSFGALPPGVLAVTCVWWVPGHHDADGRAVEADIRVSNAVGLFEPVPAADGGCAQQWDLESALTHEFGHVFGLGHVNGDLHSGLTMSDGLAPCDPSHRGLGLGDYEMLAAHYGAG